MGVQLRAVCLAFAGSVGCAAIANADAVQDFYTGKQVSLIIGSSVGGGYDSYARLVGRHFGKHIPGKPTIVVQNMPGAGSLNMTNYVYNVAPRDGSVLGASQNSVAFEPLFHLLSPGGKTARFDARKLNWIGSPTKEVYVPFVKSQSGVQVFGDLKKIPVRFGANERNTDNSLLALLLNKMFDTKIDVIHGYPGSSTALMLAMERGEIDGLAGMSYGSLIGISDHLLSEKKIRLLAQIGLGKHGDLPDVPLLLDLAESDEDRAIMQALFAKYEMARPIFTAPDVPADRVAALRAAFSATAADPAFIAEAKNQRLEIQPVRGQDIQDLVDRIYKMPDSLVQKVRGAISDPTK